MLTFVDLDMGFWFWDAYLIDGFVFRHLRVLDLVEDYLEDDEDEEMVDWISRFPETNTCLESLGFDCARCAVNFEALEALVTRSPALRRLRVNHHVSVEQLRRLMALAPQLTHLGTGSFGSVATAIPNNVVDLVSSFAASKSLVCLSGFRDVAPQYLPAIYPVCANLTSLNFSFAEISAEQLYPVIRHCHNLQNFWVLITSSLHLPKLIRVGISISNFGLCGLCIRCLMQWETKGFRQWQRHARTSGS